jgi:hypothetical protein
MNILTISLVRQDNAKRVERNKKGKDNQWDQNRQFYEIPLMLA